MSERTFGLDSIVAWAKRKWFVYPGSDIYGGLANAWDYGPYGSWLRKNISDLWIRTFIQERSDIAMMDTTIISHPETWVASGHVGSFADALIDDKKTWQRFRADKIIEEYVNGRLNDSFVIHPNDRKEKWIDISKDPESWGNAKMTEFIQWEKIVPNWYKKGTPEWLEARNFNLMLDTHLGPVADDANKVYLRPETCQPLFTDFKSVCDTTRLRIPFGLAQIGKAFRNEITPGQFLYRMREFEQMEIEYFVPADKDVAQKHYNQWKEDSMNYWLDVLQISKDHLRFKDHEKLAHYAAAATDVEYLYPWGWGEVQGVHNRTDFDLKQHQEYSKKDMQYIDTKTGDRYIPWCIEASFGLGRTVMVTMLEFYDEEEVKEGDTRVVVRFPFALAPVKYAIFPLMEKDEKMTEIAKEITINLKKQWINVEYDGGGNIGKRYRRQDEIGTPYCITVDHETLETGQVTIRHRDSMEQERIAIEQITNYK